MQFNILLKYLSLVINWHCNILHLNVNYIKQIVGLMSFRVTSIRFIFRRQMAVVAYLAPINNARRIEAIFAPDAD